MDATVLLERVPQLFEDVAPLESAVDVSLAEDVVVDHVFHILGCLKIYVDTFRRDFITDFIRIVV
jgi:hypothetical protein